MKRLKLIGLVVMFIAMCTCAHSVSAASEVSVEPGSIEVIQGNTFTVNITIDPSGNEVYGVQYELHFNNTLFNAIKQTHGTFLSHDGAGTNVFANWINNTIGVIEYGETRSSVDYGVTNPDIIATITFRALVSGTSSFDLNNVKLSDNNGDSIQNTVINGTCNIVPVESPPLPVSPTTPTTSTPITAPTQTPTEGVITEKADTTTTDNPLPPLPKPDQNATSADPAQARAQQSDEDGTAEQSGFASAFTASGLLIVSYLILRKSD